MDRFTIQAALRSDRQTVRQLESAPFSITARRIAVYSLWMVEVYTLLNEPDNAISWLEKAVENGQINYPFFSKWNPIFEDLRERPDLVNLMARVKKEWEEFDA